MHVNVKVKVKLEMVGLKIDDAVNDSVKVHVQGKVQVQAKLKVSGEAHLQVKVMYQGAWWGKWPC